MLFITELLIAAATLSDNALPEIFSTCSIPNCCMDVAPTFVISLFDKFSSSKLLFIFRQSLIALAPSSDSVLQEISSFRNILFTCMALAILMAPTLVI